LKNIWIIGCGDIGRRVAKRINGLYQNQAYRTSAVVQTRKSAQLCEKLGVEPIIYNLDNPQPLDKESFEEANLYYFAPPPKTGATDGRLDNFLNQLAQAPRKVVLISTTGVYGDCQGEWIDESRRKKLPVVQTSEAAFTNRIHADDLAHICIEAMNSHLYSEVFNTSDGTPGTMVDYFNQVADYSGLEKPRQISLKEAKTALSAGMLSYAVESRRINNAKLLNVLGIKLKYPTLTSTLK